MSETHQGLPLRYFASRTAFRKWLHRSHRDPQGIWLKFAKKKSTVASITYEEAREVALAYGWIDGLKHALDETFYAIRFTPRRKRSKWSKINRGIAEELIARAEMHPAGVKEVEAARADGRWEAAYDSQATMQVPPDFAKALSSKPQAKKFFATVSRSNRYAILYRIHDAKRPETRARRIAHYVKVLARGKVLHG